MSHQPIVWELGLTVGALIVFAVWQTVTLRRDRRITQERRRRAEEEAALGAASGTEIAEPTGPESVVRREPTPREPS